MKIDTLKSLDSTILSLLIIVFLKVNDWNVSKLPETALASLTLLIATSNPSDKRRMISLILELLGYK